MRLPFLMLVPVSVLLALAAAAVDGSLPSVTEALIVLAGALAAHISVNALNEYEDFHSGLDLKTTRTPFSGGSGTLPAHPDKAVYALWTGIAALAVALGVGLHVVLTVGAAVLPLGVAGVILILTYTRWLTRSPLACLFAPGLGFGPIMVLGCYVAWTGQYTLTALLASLPPGLLVSGLLLMNQFPDREADRESGRYHLLVAYPPEVGVWTYGALLLSNYLLIVLFVLLDLAPLPVLLALSTAPLGVRIFLRLRKVFDDLPALIPLMGRNVVLTLATPTLYALGLYLSVP
jgi:1,4-dihydroxy-2-naphthoate octaprenyltransferase